MTGNPIQKTCLMLFLFLMVFSCNDNKSLSEKIEEIKEMGNTNPAFALAMLDSLNVIIPNQSADVTNKFFLVRLRVQDKADVIPQSDLMAKKLLDYYEQHGSEAEKQEVYFYTGSVYRDLQDTPRAMEYFLKSADIAEASPLLDSVMLRNAYSNLFYLFYGVQDYDNAHKFAKMEYDLSKKLNKTELTCLMHLGMSFAAMDSLEQAKDIYIYTLDTISSTPGLEVDTEILSSLLTEFSYLRDTANASLCFKLLDNNNVGNENDGKCFAYGEYYKLTGNKDSAIYYYNCVLHNKTDIFRMYDASKALFRIYNEMEHTASANALAKEYIRISDSIDLGKRQELAATVNNEFNYHRDKRKEQEIIHENEKIRSHLFIAVIVVIAIILLAVSIISYKRNIHLKKLLELSNELNKQIVDKNKLMTEIEAKDKELKDSKVLLIQSEHDLEMQKAKLEVVNKELAQYSEELKKKELLISKKKAQNQTFLNLLHQSELECSAEDVIYAVRQSSKGIKNMSTADWKRLYKAIDELYPTFKDQLLKELGTFTEQQMQVCYLMRTGLSKTQIQNITNLSRATIWRWVKKFDRIQTMDYPTGQN